MAARVIRVTLPVGDLERATTFYGRLLHQPGRRVSEDAHEFSCGGVMLACREIRGARPHAAPLYLAVPDLENHFGRARTAGCRGIGGIETEASGERSFLVEDPFGNLLRLVEEQPAS